ncbi:MAG: methyl-accepting chemotaxis protein [Cellvibrionales bacterium]|jgi:methyl-accepting chemotaxis protein
MVSSNWLSYLNPSNLSVKALLTQAAVWIVAGNLAVLGAFVVSSSLADKARLESEQARVANDKVSAIVNEVLQLAAIEERLLRLKDLTLAEQHTALLDSAAADVDALNVLLKGKPELEAITAELSSELTRYRDAMNALVATQETVGVSQDTGLTGELGAASAAIEYNTNAIGDARLSMLHRRLQGSERGYTQSQDPDFLIPFEKSHQRYGAALAKLAIEPKLQSDITQELTRYLEAMRNLVTQETQLASNLAALQAIAGRVPLLVDDIRTITAAQTTAAQARATSTGETARWIVIGLSVSVAAFLTVGAFWLRRRIAPPLERAANVCSAIADGKLDAERPAVERTDEIGQLEQALHAMALRLRSIVGDVREGSGIMFQGASEISQSNEHLSSRTEQSAASLEETASSMEQMTVTVKQTADNALKASRLANESRAKAQEGGDVVRETVQAMGTIAQTSEQVESVIGVVDGIAFQTNLLALNAAVEAARAGEAGRGFAVVASEVRALAQRSAESAKEVRQLISVSTDSVKAGETLAERSGQFLAEIIEDTEQTAALVKEIESATREQSEGIEQVNAAIIEMDQVTQQNAAMVEEAAAAAREMEDKARSLNDLMAFFDFSEGGVPPLQVEQQPTATPALPKQSSPRPLARTASSAAPKTAVWEAF